jgi:hypothetical protein
MPEQANIDITDVRFDVWHAMLQNLVLRRLPESIAVDLWRSAIHAVGRECRCYLDGSHEDGVDLVEVYHQYRT